jgi:hypothetical protein
LVLNQRFHTRFLDGADVHEHIRRTVVRFDEAEAFLRIEKLYYTSCHDRPTSFGRYDSLGATLTPCKKRVRRWPADPKFAAAEAIRPCGTVERWSHRDERQPRQLAGRRRRVAESQFEMSLTLESCSIQSDEQAQFESNKIPGRLIEKEAPAKKEE